jgi:DNA-directed RNA polymerase specialized sigma24 family protein
MEYTPEQEARSMEHSLTRVNEHLEKIAACERLHPTITLKEKRWMEKQYRAMQKTTVTQERTAILTALSALVGKTMSAVQENGHSYSEIARVCDIKSSRVAQIVKKWNRRVKSRKIWTARGEPFAVNPWEVLP